MKKTKPAAKKGTVSREERGLPTGALELELVRDLARVATEFDLSELEIEPTGRIRITRRIPAAPLATSVVGSPPTLSSPPIAVAGSAAQSAEETVDASVYILSPFVGTFYRAPAPDAAPFVDIGQAIRKGQVACIVEAMKLMNEIESEIDGKLAEILVKNAEHVEYGQKLFRLEKA